jgi:hypothetical protein
MRTKRVQKTESKNTRGAIRIRAERVYKVLPIVRGIRLIIIMVVEIR